MLRLWNRERKAVTVTQNLMLELKYAVSKKTDNDFPRRAGHRSSPARPSKLPAPGSPYCHTLMIVLQVCCTMCTWACWLCFAPTPPTFCLGSMDWKWDSPGSSVCLSSCTTSLNSQVTTGKIEVLVRLSVCLSVLHNFSELSGNHWKKDSLGSSVCLSVLLHNFIELSGEDWKKGTLGSSVCLLSLIHISEPTRQS